MLAINVVLFLVVATAGFWQGSNALISDADSLGDALVYTVSPFVVARRHIVDVTDRRLYPNLSIEADRSGSPDRLALRKANLRSNR